MPFPQVAKDNYALSLTLASFFTDGDQKYFSTSERIDALIELRCCTRWQASHPYSLAKAGNRLIKKTLLPYLAFESSIDLFMRYIPVPTCPVQENLAYLDSNVQNLFFKHFKNSIVRDLLKDRNSPTVNQIEDRLRDYAKTVVLGYKHRLPDLDMSREEWNIYVAEINASINKLATAYYSILRDLHNQFSDFRKGQLEFLQNYLDRCLLLTQTERYLRDIQTQRAHPAADEGEVKAFCDNLKKLEQYYQEFSLQELHSSLDYLRAHSLSQAQHHTIAECMIRLKAKYDLYSTGEDSLSEDEQLNSYRDAWPKPKLPCLAKPPVNKEAEEAWNKMREHQRDQREEELRLKALQHKTKSTASLIRGFQPAR